MTTIIEKDSSTSAILLVFAVLLLVAGGLFFAYMNGAFGARTTVIENHKTIENKTFVMPEQPPSHAESSEKKP
ncbi:MAG: hypothetical protein PHD76_02995 [Methylacidiphilales bacterium]|nr:hypothetical protein [Candidatus Methylacidiphilales bacterium]